MDAPSSPMRRCPGCREEKPNTSEHWNRGCHRCKPCDKARMRAYRKTAKGMAMKRRAMAKRRLRQKGTEKAFKARQRRYLNIKADPIRKAKDRARNDCRKAIKSGRLVRGPCSVCGTTERVHAHHADYTKKYDVTWLCYGCHRAHHEAEGTFGTIHPDR